jgi:hypothetical protein
LLLWGVSPGLGALGSPPSLTLPPKGEGNAMAFADSSAHGGGVLA